MKMSLEEAKKLLRREFPDPRAGHTASYFMGHRVTEFEGDDLLRLIEWASRQANEERKRLDDYVGFMQTIETARRRLRCFPPPVSDDDYTFQANEEKGVTDGGGSNP